MIKNYAINSKATPIELKNAGFNKVNLISRGETYRLHTYLHERVISLRITVGFPTDKDGKIYSEVDIWDECNNQPYAIMYSEYGKSSLRDKVNRKYEIEMQKLVEKELFSEV